MAFDGSEGTIIDKDQAAPMTTAYQEAHPGEFRAQFFGKDKLKELVADCGAEYVGIRIYNALDDAGNQSFVIVGVKADENDMYDKAILATGPSCPPCCAPASPLNL